MRIWVVEEWLVLGLQRWRASWTSQSFDSPLRFPKVKDDFCFSVGAMTEWTECSIDILENNPVFWFFPNRWWGWEEDGKDSKRREKEEARWARVLSFNRLRSSRTEWRTLQTSPDVICERQKRAEAKRRFSLLVREVRLRKMEKILTSRFACWYLHKKENKDRAESKQQRASSTSCVNSLPYLERKRPFCFVKEERRRLNRNAENLSTCFFFFFAYVFDVRFYTRKIWIIPFIIELSW